MKVVNSSAIKTNITQVRMIYSLEFDESKTAYT